MSAIDQVHSVAQAVLYEGYLLWPYRRSAPKNRQRWTFGGVHPRGWSEAGHADDAWRIQTECLLVGDEQAMVEVTVRFLQIVERSLRDAGGAPVDRLTVGDEDHLAWQEATEREISLPERSLRALAAEPARAEIEIATGSRERALTDAHGEHAGVVVHGWERLHGTVTAGASELRSGIWRLGVEIENTTPWQGGDRQATQRQSLASTHTVLRARAGEFVSLTDPPEALRAEAGECVNRGAWPVLVGEPGARDAILSAPIILPDYPQVAPESPGDLFDATEIDRLLILDTLSLTDDEQRELRATDPRAREILDRCRALGREDLMRLHLGAMRELRTLGKR